MIFLFNPFIGLFLNFFPIPYFRLHLLSLNQLKEGVGMFIRFLFLALFSRDNYLNTLGTSHPQIWVLVLNRLNIIIAFLVTGKLGHFSDHVFDDLDVTFFEGRHQRRTISAVGDCRVSALFYQLLDNIEMSGIAGKPDRSVSCLALQKFDDISIK
jgi:hypothetical protein